MTGLSCRCARWKPYRQSKTSPNISVHAYVVVADDNLNRQQLGLEHRSVFLVSSRSQNTAVVTARAPSRALVSILPNLVLRALCQFLFSIRCLTFERFGLCRFLMLGAPKCYRKASQSAALLRWHIGPLRTLLVATRREGG